MFRGRPVKITQTGANCIANSVITGWPPVGNANTQVGNQTPGAGGGGGTITIKGVPGLDAERSVLDDPKRIVLVFQRVPGNLEIRMDGLFDDCDIECNIVADVGGNVAMGQGRVSILGNVQGDTQVSEGDVRVQGDVHGTVRCTNGNVTVPNGNIGTAVTVSGDIRAGGDIGVNKARSVSGTVTADKKRKRVDGEENEPKKRKT